MTATEILSILCMSLFNRDSSKDKQELQFWIERIKHTLEMLEELSNDESS